MSGFGIRRCCCTEEEEPPTAPGCTICPEDDMPICWELVLAGLDGTDPACHDCADYNGTYILERFGSTPPNYNCAARYKTSDTSTCAFNLMIHLAPQPDPSGYWFLSFITGWTSDTPGFPGGSTRASWRLLRSAFSCTGPNTFESFSATSWCNNWPSTVTLTAANCP